MSLMAPTRYKMPPELKFAELLYETGWPPDVLLEADMNEVQKFILYKNIRLVKDFGGEIVWPTKRA